MRVKAGIAAVVCLTSVAFGQGSLTPPGAPGATMKTLDELDAAIADVSNAVGQIKGDPRTPISSVPYTISEPGSYYLTTNLTSTGHGVVITTSDVTLDLMGFTLSGDGGFGDYGVFVDGAPNRVVEHVVVRNGAARKFADGIWAEYSMGGRFEQLSLFDNTYDGIDLFGQSGQCNGNTIADCTIRENDNYGVYLSGNSGQCNDNTVADCSISGNSNFGIIFNGSSGQCDGNTIANCAISANGNYGIYLYEVSSGQCDGNTIADCTIRKNRDRGISLAYADGNRVEGNHVTGQIGGTTYGILCSSTTNNLIIRNSCVGQTDNFYFSSNDTYGPEITASGEISSANPWANFSF